MNHKASQGYRILIATSLVSAVLGSIHAFSVFLEPLETKFGTSRATASLTYSIGLVFLTAAVLFGPAIYGRLRPATIYIGVSVIGAAGATLAGLAENIVVVWLGYSVVFGIANGLGYGFGLQFAARANPNIAGLAMGLVTAAYAIGATIGPYGFEWAMTEGGFRAAMLALAGSIFLAGLFSAFLIAQSQVRYLDTHAPRIFSKTPSARIALIWVSYGAAVFAGLMAIGHAASIAIGAEFTGWTAPAILAGFNLLGSLVSGWLTDRTSHRRILTTLPLVTAMSLIALTTFPSLTLICLGFVGFAYGGTIAAYPAAIFQQFPGEDGPRIYGRIFTAWGAAGLLAPWTAGKIFDLSGSYGPALWSASALALVAALVTQKSINTPR